MSKIDFGDMFKISKEIVDGMETELKQMNICGKILDDVRISFDDHAKFNILTPRNNICTVTGLTIDNGRLYATVNQNGMYCQFRLINLNVEDILRVRERVCNDEYSFTVMDNSTIIVTLYPESGEYLIHQDNTTLFKTFTDIQDVLKYVSEFGRDGIEVKFDGHALVV